MNGWTPPAPGAEGLFDPVTPPDAAATTQCARCPWARSDMTPCVIKDGEMCYAEDGHCVGCGYDRNAIAVAMSSETKTPSAEPVAWIAPEDLEIVRRLALAADVVLTQIKMPHRTVPLYTHPSPDVRDAERYRHWRAWMCSEDYLAMDDPLLLALGDAKTFDEVDRAIDTAIAKEKL